MEVIAVAAQEKGYCRGTIWVCATVKGYGNLGVQVQNRVSFFGKLLKILLWTRETGKRNRQLTLG